MLSQGRGACKRSPSGNDGWPIGKAFITSCMATGALHASAGPEFPSQCHESSGLLRGLRPLGNVQHSVPWSPYHVCVLLTGIDTELTLSAHLQFGFGRVPCSCLLTPLSFCCVRSSFRSPQLSPQLSNQRRGVAALLPRLRHLFSLLWDKSKRRICYSKGRLLNSMLHLAFLRTVRLRRSSRKRNNALIVGKSACILSQEFEANDSAQTRYVCLCGQQLCGKLDSRGILCPCLLFQERTG